GTLVSGCQKSNKKKPFHHNGNIMFHMTHILHPKNIMFLAWYSSNVNRLINSKKKMKSNHKPITINQNMDTIFIQRMNLSSNEIIKEPIENFFTILNKSIQKSKDNVEKTVHNLEYQLAQTK
ncbi:hypothetical protein ACJX0J_030137, partial [Zea mays]